MESVQPPAGSQVSRVPAQRTPPDQVVPAPAPPAPVRSRQRLRTVLTVAGVVFAVLCLSGGVTAYLLYDRAATPDRSAPDVVVDNYLRAFLVDRNDTKAALFTCETGQGGLAGVRALRTDLQAREQRFGTALSVKWGSLRVVDKKDVAQVHVDLTISAYVEGISQSDRQTWQFTTRLEDDWRVCAATPAA